MDLTVSTVNRETMDIVVYGCLSVDFCLPARNRMDIVVYGCLSVDFCLPARNRMDILVYACLSVDFYLPARAYSFRSAYTLQGDELRKL